MARDFSTDPSLIQKEVEQNLAKGFPEAYLDVVRHADLSSLTWAPLMLRAPWSIVAGPMQRGSVTVAGDAMHPMTPDLGQGGCSALEDAVVLARSIGPALIAGGLERCCAKEVEEGMKKYVGERRWRVAGLVTGSYVSGWVQQGGSGSGLGGWFVKWFRDHVFYRFLSTRIASAVNYDCGGLPKLE
ncbi:uncharacterized protein M6B38_412130 [Iris pallida]|uniref:FAD-binding domain-containing protein n=1 Tax=Iris pallida TaxID=29817 RepID=A0AAX6FLP0_IRIPA|nr:uncharacterized protein M6B38_412130 [Iris pallida]